MARFVKLVWSAPPHEAVPVGENNTHRVSGALKGSIIPIAQAHENITL